ncbi:MAG TPA: hypothetical protein VMB81_05165 [Candidatus Sulfotelmatobacter sp.]|nr:hypothetical protein [Candidatus Sulfotelmatobacter sp.]
MSYRPNDPRSKLGRQLLRDLGERETPERRTGPRFLAPTLDVKLDRKIYQTVDWGLGALVVGNYDGDPKPDTKMTIVLSREKDPETTHTATARVIRVDKKKRLLTLQFLEVGKGMLSWLGDLQMHGDA